MGSVISGTHRSSDRSALPLNKLASGHCLFGMPGRGLRRQMA